MNEQDAEQLLDRWQNDPTFKAELRQDPEGAARRAGIALAEEDVAALKSIDWSLPDEELAERLSKRSSYWC